MSIFKKKDNENIIEYDICTIVDNKIISTKVKKEVDLNCINCGCKMDKKDIEYLNQKPIIYCQNCGQENIL